MPWPVVIVVSALAALVFAASRPMRVNRDPDREGYQDAEAALAYHRMSQWLIFRLERRIILRQVSRLRPSGVLVDIGCGPGHVTRMVSRSFPLLTVIGMDNNRAMLDIAREVTGGALALTRGSAERLPFASNSIDCIISSLSLHHWPDIDRALDEILRVLRPGGKYLIFDLRRDMPRIVYLSLVIGQALTAPPAIKRTNGAVGSFYASYTVREFKDRLNRRFNSSRVDTCLAWQMARGIKRS